MKSLSRDTRFLADHATFLAQKVTFLLDATLGMISIQQNAIIKIFSVAAVIFLPPTLVASIYGMNFQVMPELEWAFGYPMAILLMIASAVVSYWVFKIRGLAVARSCTRATPPPTAPAVAEPMSSGTSGGAHSVHRFGEDRHARGRGHVRLD